VVVRQVGRGTFLAPRAVPDISPAQVMAARLLLEPQLLGPAVANATPRHLAELQRCLAGGRQAASAEEFELWDARLHAAIAAATANPLLVQMYQVVAEARDDRNAPRAGALMRRHLLRIRAILLDDPEGAEGAISLPVDTGPPAS